MIDDPADAVPDKSGDPDPAEYANTSENPDDWVDGDKPMTAVQIAYLRALCEETGERFDPALTQAAASELIDTLRVRAERLTGAPADNPDMS